MKSEGRRVTFKSLLIPRYPASVIVPSAITRARVPASVESSPPLYVPLESREDITRDRSERLTPGKIEIRVSSSVKDYTAIDFSSVLIPTDENIFTLKTVSIALSFY